jgi:hypothetical protein
VRTYTREFWCETCGQKESMNGAQLKAHLNDVHQLEGRITGNKSLTFALDFEGGHSNTLVWKLPGVKITEVESSKTVEARRVG